jgi:hypothetical protein
MSDAAEQGRHPDTTVSGETSHETGSSPHHAVPADAGPGRVGGELSTIKERLRDLGTDKTLPAQERDLYRLVYAHQCNKLQLQLAVLGQKEKVQSTERALEEARKAVDLARSEGRELAENAQNNELTAAENQLAEAEASHGTVRSELQALLSTLEHLRANNAKWEKAMPSVRRWEVGRRWEAITPDTLRPAVLAIREAFDDNCWRCEQSTSKNRLSIPTAVSKFRCASCCISARNACGAAVVVLLPGSLTGTLRLVPFGIAGLQICVA